MIEDITERKPAELVPDALTERELEVLALVAQCCTSKKVARELGYSEGMIRHRVGNVIKKLGVRNRGQAAERAVEIGLIPPPR